MPVLIVLLMSLIAVGLMSWWFVQWMRSAEAQTVIEEDGDEPFSAIPLALAFEPDYAIIWDTQVPAMELISRAGALGLALPRLWRCYVEQSTRYPELYEGSSFRNWIAFLEQAQLIECDDDAVVLTREGQEFLKYRVATAPVTMRHETGR